MNSIDEMAYEQLMGDERYKKQIRKIRIGSGVMIPVFLLICWLCRSQPIYILLIPIAFVVVLVIGFLSSFSKPHMCRYGLISEVKHSQCLEGNGGENEVDRVVDYHYYTVTVDGEILPRPVREEGTQQFFTGDEVIVWQQGKMDYFILPRDHRMIEVRGLRHISFAGWERWFCWCHLCFPR